MLKSKNIYLPKGFKFKVVPYYDKHMVVQLYHNNFIIGRLELIYDSRTKFYVTHSTLSNTYHGKGLGAKLYAKGIKWCIENGHRVKSSSSPSFFAQRVWNGTYIRKHFNVSKRRESYSGSMAWFPYRKSAVV